MNIAVIFGGESCEHDISIITGVQLMTNMNEYLYNVYPIYINKVGAWLTGENLNDVVNFTNDLKKLKECAFLPNDSGLYIKKRGKYKKLVDIDVVFVCLHGMRGEDGAVAGILEMSKIPYSSSSICASSICMDKCVFKYFAKGMGVNIVDGICVGKKEYLSDYESVFEKVKNLGLPIIIKPSRQGSSIGIEVCESLDAFKNQVEKAFKYDDKLLIEKFVSIKKEVNVAVLNNKHDFIISNTEEPITSDKILSFDNKYRKNTGGFETIKRKMPADISEEQESLIKQYATNVYVTLDMCGPVRFDFLIDDNDNIFLNEVNTIPGSMANYLFDKKKYGYEKLIEIMISNALLRSENAKKITKVFVSDVLENDFDGFKK